jgi:hypothetical protein
MHVCEFLCPSCPLRCILSLTSGVVVSLECARARLRLVTYSHTHIHVLASMHTRIHSLRCILSLASTASFVRMRSQMRTAIHMHAHTHTRTHAHPPTRIPSHPPTYKRTPQRCGEAWLRLCSLPPKNQPVVKAHASMVKTTVEFKELMMVSQAAEITSTTCCGSTLIRCYPRCWMKPPLWSRWEECLPPRTLARCSRTATESR